MAAPTNDLGPRGLQLGLLRPLAHKLFSVLRSLTSAAGEWIHCSKR